ncbi:MAG: hypothetical protein ACRC76_10570 [Proteocatella sp.]
MKKITPIIITIIVCFFITLYAFGFIMAALTESTLIIKIGAFALALIPIGIIIAMIFTLIERLKEIKEEDKDDLSKY